MKQKRNANKLELRKTTKNVFFCVKKKRKKYSKKLPARTSGKLPETSGDSKLSQTKFTGKKEHIETLLFFLIPAFFESLICKGDVSRALGSPRYRRPAAGVMFPWLGGVGGTGVQRRG